MISALSLPKSINVGGVEHAIKTDFRDIWKILPLFDDPDFDSEEKAIAFVQLIYLDDIPPEHFEEAYKKGIEFIDAGMPKDGKQKAQIVDWEQDAPLIIPAVYNTLGEVRNVPYLHWWTFLGGYMAISSESLYGSILAIRRKLSKGKKLEKHEQEFYRENRHLIDLKHKYSSADKELLAQRGIRI